MLGIGLSCLSAGSTPYHTFEPLGISIWRGSPHASASLGMTGIESICLGLPSAGSTPYQTVLPSLSLPLVMFVQPLGSCGAPGTGSKAPVALLVPHSVPPICIMQLWPSLLGSAFCWSTMSFNWKPQPEPLAGSVAVYTPGLLRSSQTLANLSVLISLELGLRILMTYEFLGESMVGGLVGSFGLELSQSGLALLSTS